MLKNAFAPVTVLDPYDQRRLYLSDPEIVDVTCDMATRTLRKKLGLAEISVRPFHQAVVDDWKDQWGAKSRFAASWETTYLHEICEGPYFGFALYDKELLCGMTQNALSLVISNDANFDLVETDSSDIETVESINRRHRLSGYVFACLTEAACNTAGSKVFKKLRSVMLGTALFRSTLKDWDSGMTTPASTSTPVFF